MLRFPFLVGLIFILLFASTAYAADIDYDYYANIKLETFYIDQEDAAGDSSANLDFDLLYTSNVGLMVGVDGLEKEAGIDNVKGHIELGLNPSNNSYYKDIYLRLAYGTVTFEKFTLLIGQTYAPYVWGPNQVYQDWYFMGFGSLFDIRNPMVQVKFDNGFHLTAIRPDAAGVTGAEDSEIQKFMPRLVVGYDGKIGSMIYGVGLTYQSYKEKSAATDFDESIDSYFVYGHGLAKITDAFSLNFNVHYGQNVGECGMLVRDNAKPVVVGTNLEDTISYGGFVEGIITLSKTLSMNTGVGYTVGDNDAWSEKDDQVSVFVNATYAVNKYLQIVPEVSYFDYLDDESGNSEGNELVAGVRWNIHF